MADDTVRDDLNLIVQTIGFGIVSDFRELKNSLSDITSQVDESNRILGNVNLNLESTTKSLDDLEKDIYRQIDSRQFRQLENQIEQKNRNQIKRTDEVTRGILNAVNDIKRQVGMVRMKIDAEGNVTQENTAPPPGVPTPDTQSGGGAFPLPSSGSGAGAFMMGAAALGTLAAVGTAAYSMNQSDASASRQPPTVQTPPVAPALSMTNSAGPVMSTQSSYSSSPLSASSSASLASAPVPSVSVAPPKINTNLSNISQSVSAITTTTKSKALAKVQAKAANWFSRNGGRIVNTIGPTNIAVFGKLVGGRFYFNKFVSDDSWTQLGLAYIYGQSAPASQSNNPNIIFVSEVVINLSIQAYLISSEIYTAENASEIINGLVPNFDDIPENDRKQVVKNVGANLEAYVNFLIDRSRAQRNITGAGSAASSAPGSTGTGANLAPIAGGGQSGAALGGVLSGGGYTGGGPTGSPAPQSEAGGPSGSPTDPSNMGGPTSSSSGTEAPQTTAPTESPAATGSDTQETELPTDAQVSPSDTTATFSNSTNQAGGLESGTYRPVYGGINADLQDQDLINIIGNEAGQGNEGIDAVVNNMMNRLDSPSYGNPSSLSEVAKQRNQYRSWDYLKSGRFKPVSKAKAAQIRARMKLIASGAVPDNTGGANEFRASSYVNSDEGSRGSFARDYRKKGGVNIKGNIFVRRNYKPGPYAAFPKPKSKKETNSETLNSSSSLTTGGLITPLPSDAISSNISNALAPSMDQTNSYQTYENGASGGENTASASVSSIDARPKGQTVNPHDEAKNKIAYYQYLMLHHFGHLKEDMKQAHEEVTADIYHFERAMDPLV